MTSGGNFCERCGAPLAKPSVRSLVAFKDADLGPERGSFVSEYSDRQKALLSSNSPSEPGWFEDPLDAGWARRFDGQKWLGLQRRVLTEWEKVERATNSIEPTELSKPPVNSVSRSPAQPPSTSPSETASTTRMRNAAIPAEAIGKLSGTESWLGGRGSAHVLVGLAVLGLLVVLVFAWPKSHHPFLELGWAQNSAAEREELCGNLASSVMYRENFFIGFSDTTSRVTYSEVRDFYSDMCGL
ncbi:MAG: hypothetical protein WC054_08085 [Candidatus Nanopelagicales bacterium]